MMCKIYFFIVMGLSIVFGGFSQTLTPFEAKGYNYTPTYEETMAFCRHLAKQSKMIHLTTLGKSSGGYGIPLLVIDKNGFTKVNQIRKKGRLILLVIACIHPGEPDGKDAMLLLLRDILEQRHDLHRLLDNITLLFIPIFNVDGHLRYGHHTRINQQGPEQSGWRTNSLNLNLNRDFIKAETIEMQQFLKFYHHWSPDFVIDCHTTNGADYQYLLTYAIETGYYTHPLIAQWTREKYLSNVLNQLHVKGIQTFPYISFRNWHDIETTVMHYPSPPIISNGYVAITNRPGLLIETHMLKPYRQRVEATYWMIVETMRYLAQYHTELLNVIREADRQMFDYVSFANDFPVEIGLKPDSVLIDFLGVRYEKVISELTGFSYYKYYSNEPQVWKRYFLGQQEVKKTINLPYFYVIPPQWRILAERLSVHNVHFCQLSEPVKLPVRMIRFTDVRFDDKPYEGRQRVYYNIFEFDTVMLFPPGSFVIPVHQPSGRIIAYALEPSSRFSFVAWGYMNSIFEQKEYSEIYKMEEIAARMVKEDSTLLRAFLTAKALELAQFQSQWEQLQWFYQRSPWFDPLLNVYPVGRVYDQTLMNFKRCSASGSRKERNLKSP